MDQPKQVGRKKTWRYLLAGVTWFVSGIWAMHYYNFEGGHVYHPGRGGPIAASCAGALFLALTTFWVHTVFKSQPKARKGTGPLG